MFLVKKTEPTASLCFEKIINFVKNKNKSNQIVKQIKEKIAQQHFKAQFQPISTEEILSQNTTFPKSLKINRNRKK